MTPGNFLARISRALVAFLPDTVGHKEKEMSEAQTLMTGIAFGESGGGDRCRFVRPPGTTMAARRSLRRVVRSGGHGEGAI